MIQSAGEILRQEGREEVSKEVATKMLQKGVDSETIADFTQLSKDRILELQRDSKENSEL